MMEIKKWVVLLTKAFGCVLLGIGVGTLAMCLICLVPTKFVEQHVKNSANVFESEGAYRCLNPKYANTVLDNYTDAIMLSECVAQNSEDSLIEAAMNGTYLKALNGGSLEALIAYRDGDREQYANQNYSRYWHGYTTVLKLLLCTFDYGQIRILNGICIAVLAVFTTIYVARCTKMKYGLAYGAMILCLSPSVFPYSLQNSTMFYIANISTILICCFRKKIQEYEWGSLLLFTIIGMMTSFFDFLTFPSLAIGVAMVLVVIIQLEGKLLKTIYYLFKAGISWVIGYAGMWAGKWIVASVILNRNVLQEAAESVLLRVGNTYEKYIMGYPYTMNIYWYEKIQLPFTMILTRPVILLSVAILVSAFVLMIISRNKKLHRKKNLLLFGCVALIPQVWFFVVQNHSYVHVFFTFRAFGTFFFAMFAFAMSVFDIEGKKWGMSRKNGYKK